METTNGAISLPPLAPGQLGDREKLMHHISILSATVARLQLQLAQANIGGGDGTSATAGASSSFDPIVANNEILRLNKVLAQQSLLQEAREAHFRAVEGECAALRDERAILLRSNAELEDGMNSMEEKLAQLAAQLQAAHGVEDEVHFLRERERELTAALVVARSADPVVRVVRSGDAGSGPGFASRHQRELFLRFEESVAAHREALLLDMFFAPLQDAFVAGAEWILSQQRWEEECIALRDAAHREQAEWSALQEAQLNNGVAAALQHQLSQSEQHALSLRAELEAHRQQAIFLQSTNERLERALAAERQRLEAKSTLYHEAMQRVHDEVVEQRQQFLAEVRAEMALKLKDAFRNGRRYERRQRQGHDSAAAAAAAFASAQPAVVGDATALPPLPEGHSGTGRGGGSAHQNAFIVVSSSSSSPTAAAARSESPSSVGNATLQDSRGSLTPARQQQQRHFMQHSGADDGDE